MDVALGAALILTGTGQRPFAELIGHHLALGFGAPSSAERAQDWYGMAVISLEGGATPVFAPGQPGRPELIKAASAKLAGGRVQPVQASGGTRHCHPLINVVNAGNETLGAQAQHLMNRVRNEAVLLCSPGFAGVFVGLGTAECLLGSERSCRLRRVCCFPPLARGLWSAAGFVQSRPQLSERYSFTVLSLIVRFLRSAWLAIQKTVPCAVF